MSEEEQKLYMEPMDDEPEDFQGEGGVDDEDNTDSSGALPPARIEYPLNVETEVPGTKGQLFKTVLKAAPAETKDLFPKKGDEITCDYTGTLASDGSEFDSSRKPGRGEFITAIGVGAVIKCWDVGMMTMAKGERAILRCLPEYGYDAAGSGAAIPPNAELKFDVELHDFIKKAEDVSTARDKTVMKTEIDAGQGHAKPAYESHIVCDAVVYKGAEADAANAAFSKMGLEFELGDFLCPQAFEDAVTSMRKGETASFLMRGPQAGPMFLKLTELFSGVAPPADSAPITFTLKLTLRDFDVVKTYGFKNDAKLAEALKRKEAGNGYFVKKSLMQAKKKYERGLIFVESDYGLDEDGLVEKATELKLAFLGNIAQCCLAMGDLGGCIANCDKALEVRPGHAKSLFRKARALNAKEEWDAAEALLRQILEADAGNADAANELAAIVAKKQAHKQKEKAIFGKMFA